LSTHDHAARLEQVGDAAGLAHVAAVLGEDVADVARGAVAVVGRDLDQQRHAGRTVALVLGLLVVRTLDLAGAALDGALDIGRRHVDGLRGRDRGAQARIGRGHRPPNGRRW
jgi:hypothetical protein